MEAAEHDEASVSNPDHLTTGYTVGAGVKSALGGSLKTQTTANI